MGANHVWYALAVRLSAKMVWHRAHCCANVVVIFSSQLSVFSTQLFDENECKGTAFF